MSGPAHLGGVRMETLAPGFTTADRCDRCGARAHLRAWVPGGMLQFCDHHARHHHAALVKSGAFLQTDDE